MHKRVISLLADVPRQVLRHGGGYGSSLAVAGSLSRGWLPRNANKCVLHKVNVSRIRTFLFLFLLLLPKTIYCLLKVKSFQGGGVVNILFSASPKILEVGSRSVEALVMTNILSWIECHCRICQVDQQALQDFFVETTLTHGCDCESVASMLV